MCRHKTRTRPSVLKHDAENVNDAMHYAIIRLVRKHTHKRLQTEGVGDENVECVYIGHTDQGHKHK